MFHVILHEPKIPPNTGNVIRLCANSGATLHLIEPLGFSLEAKELRRAGLDYHELARVVRHRDLDTCLKSLAPSTVHVIETAGTRPYTAAGYRPGDALLFGTETEGLPPAVLGRFPVANLVHIPMLPGNRSVNLSNAVAIVVYEAWRQNGFRIGGQP